VRKVLFVCSRNRLRSPTAEQVFSRRHDLEVASAGTNHDADVPVTADLVAWADVIFAMERVHATKLRQRFGKQLKSTRLVCLDIPDDYAFMDPALVDLLENKVARHLR
jgi:predicted protein tyrosine phosphatase